MDIDEDLDRARRAAKNDPQNPQLLVNLGQFLARAGDLTAAENLFRRAIALDPDRVAFHVTLSHLLARAGRIAEALTEVSHALDLNPDNIGNMCHLANLLTKSGEIQAAEQVYQRALQLEPSARVHVARSHFFIGQGRIDEAIEASERAIELDFQNAAFRAHYRRLLARKGLSSEPDPTLEQTAAPSPVGQTCDHQLEEPTQQCDQEPAPTASEVPQPQLLSGTGVGSAVDGVTSGPSTISPPHEIASDRKSLTGSLLNRLLRRQRRAALRP